MKLAPVPKRALSDHVFEQLTGQIVSGALQPGTALPSERALTEALGVNRGAIREAVKRLAEAGLVSSRHGTGNLVLDYRQSASLALLPRLLFATGDLNEEVFRSVMELRSAIAPDAARLCAERSPQRAATLEGLCEQLQTTADLSQRQALASQFWEQIVDGSQNIAYRLAYNSVRTIFERAREALAPALAEELRDIEGYRAITNAVGHGSGFTAQCEAAALTEQSLQAPAAAHSPGR